MNCASLVIRYDTVLLDVPLTYADVDLIDAAAALLLEGHRGSRIFRSGRHLVRLGRDGRLRVGGRPTSRCFATSDGEVGTAPDAQRRFRPRASAAAYAVVQAHSADERELIALCGIRDLVARIQPYGVGATQLQDNQWADPRGGRTAYVTHTLLPSLLLFMRLLAVSRLDDDARHIAATLIGAGTDCGPGDLVAAAQAMAAAPTA